MNIRSEHDGLEMVSEHGRWTLYLVEDDGRKYTALGTMHGRDSVALLMGYLALAPRFSNDNLCEVDR